MALQVICLTSKNNTAVLGYGNTLPTPAPSSCQDGQLAYPTINITNMEQ